jgi:O-antigen ligase
MDLAARCTALQRAITIALLPAVAIVLWPRGAEMFQLPKATLVVVAALACLGMEVVRAAWTRRVDVAFGAAGIAACAFLVIAAVATVLSPTPLASSIGRYGVYAGLVSYVAYGVVFAGAARLLRCADDAARLLRAGAVGLAIVAGYGVLQALGIELLTVRSEVTSPVFATMGNANFAAGWTGMMVPAGLWVAIAHRTWGWRVVGSVAVAGALVVATASRSFQGPVTLAVSGVAFAAFATLARGGRFASRRREVIAGSVVFFAAVGLVVMTTPVGGPVRDEVADGLRERTLIWDAAAADSAENPVLGSGLDTFGDRFFAFRSAEHAVAYGAVNAETPHNVLLAMLVGGGIPLLIAYVGFVGLVGACLLRALASADEASRLVVAGVGAAWVGYQVQSTVSFDVPATATAHWLLAGALVALAGRRSREIVLPGQPVKAVGKGRHRRLAVPSSTWVIVVTVGLVGLAALLPVTRPLRADLALRSASDAASTGDASLVREHFERVHRLAPWQGRYWSFRSVFEEQAGDPTAAFEAAEEAARRDPGEVSDARRAALLAAQAGRFEQAERWFTEALRRDPHNPSLWEQAAQYYVDLGNDERAQILLEEAEDLRRAASS